MFDLEFHELDQRQFEAKTARLDRQVILCAFRPMTTVYRHGEIVQHTRHHSLEIRSQDLSPKWQKACSRMEREFESDGPSVEHAVLAFLMDDLMDRWPTIDSTGFDVGVMVTPRGKDDRLTNGGLLICGIFPRGEQKVDAEHAWPLLWAPCTLTLRIHPEEHRELFWGLVGTGLQQTLERAGLTFRLDADAHTAADRHKDGYRKALDSVPLGPLFVTDWYKHSYFRFVLLYLLNHVSLKLRGEPLELGELSSELEVHERQDHAVVARSKPWMKL